MSTNYGFEPTLDGLNTIDADSMTTTDIVCDTITVNTKATINSIQSALPTSNIDIGSELTTGDVNLGNSAVATGVALNWGGASNSGNLTFQGGTFNMFGTGNFFIRSGPTFSMNIADNQTSGILNIATGSSRTGAINIATGATTTSTAISIGNQSGAFGSVDIGTTTVTVGKSNTATNNIQTSTNGTLNLKTTSTGGNVNLGTGMTSGSITIGGGASSATNILIGSSQTTYTGSIAIGTVVTGNAPITIGSSASSTQIATHNANTTFSKIPSCAVAPTTANHLCNKTYTDSVAGGSALLTSNNIFSGTNTFTNTVNLNITGTADTNIGSASNITYLSGNTTVTGAPIVLNYAVSSHSELTGATVLTQLNGTFRSTVTWTAWTTGTFNYVMNQFIPGVPGWTWPGGFITLAAGTYSFNFAFSFEDNAAGYNITDLRVGISTSAALTAASTDTTVIASLPGGNRTCYKHYVTTITPSINDIVVEQMSGSFYLSASTAIYPHCRINNSAAGGINTVIFDLTITRIGL